jgi:chromosome segregation ATPase
VSTATVLNALGFAGGLGGLAALLKVFIDRTKVRSDAVDQIADTSMRLLTPLNEEIDRLRSSLRSAESELSDLRRQMRAFAERNEEAEAAKAKARISDETIGTLRTQIRGLYDEIADKDRSLAERDRLIADLRAGRQAP